MHRRPRPRWALIPLVLIALLVALAAGCGDDSEPSASAPPSTPAAEAGASPVTVRHKHDATVIPAEPKRVVAIGATDADIAVALGVTPVGISKGNPARVDSWLAEALGDADPAVLDVDTGVPFEQVAALEPDLILAGDLFTIDEDYARLAQIAPTVAYRAGDGPFLESWQERALVVGEALGREPEARALVAAAEARIAAAAKAHPEWRGRTFSFNNYTEPGKMVSLQSGPVIAFFEGLGLTLAPGVKALPEDAYGNAAVSLERLDALRADAILQVFMSTELIGDLEGRPVFRRLVAARPDAYQRVELELAVALRTPSALSIPWALDRLEPKLTAALGQ